MLYLTMSDEPKKKLRGFAALSPEQRRAVSRKGGSTSAALGRSHRWTSEEAREAGKKGGASSARKRTEDGQPAT